MITKIAVATLVFCAAMNLSASPASAGFNDDFLESLTGMSAGSGR